MKHLQTENPSDSKLMSIKCFVMRQVKKILKV